MTDPATIERLAHEAGYIVGEYGIAHLQYGLEDATELLTRFAALVEAQQERTIEVLRGERDHARARVDSAVRLLTGIHSLLYPAPIKTADGRAMVFRPTNPDPHEVLQELSDRIRALPDELAKLAEST
jgi:hypothetical protein